MGMRLRLLSGGTAKSVVSVIFQLYVNLLHKAFSFALGRRLFISRRSDFRSPSRRDHDHHQRFDRLNAELCLDRIKVLIPLSNGNLLFFASSLPDYLKHQDRPCHARIQ